MKRLPEIGTLAQHQKTQEQVVAGHGHDHAVKAPVKPMRFSCWAALAVAVAKNGAAHHRAARFDAQRRVLVPGASWAGNQKLRTCTGRVAKARRSPLR